MVDHGLYQGHRRGDRPDIVIIARTLEDWDQFDNLGGAQYVKGIERELTKYDIPVIPVSSQVLGPC